MIKVYLDMDPEAGLSVSPEDIGGRLPMEVDPAVYDSYCRAIDAVNTLEEPFSRYYVEHEKEAEKVSHEWLYGQKTQTMDDETTYTVNNEPVAKPEDPVEREAPAEATSEAEIDDFDKKARQSFDRELAKHQQEIRPGSKEAEVAIRDAIRQGSK